jgi:amidophosphoribosyltransferase
MSDNLTHECGIALIRLKKPLSYYQDKYGSPLWGFNKLFLLMEKQHNRGQDGAGIAAVKFDAPVGRQYMFRERCVKANPLDRIFKRLFADYNAKVAAGLIHPEFAETVKRHFDFGAELLMAHLRYGTSGGYNISSCHPFFRRSPWPTRNLALCGNFNMTNTAELNESLVALGQHPIISSDTQALLELIGHYLDEEHEDIYRRIRASGLPGAEISRRISADLDPARVLARAARRWDGAYALCGLIGNGDAFVARDPAGIRPCHWYQDDEVIAFASERAPLMTVFDAAADQVSEVRPGNIVVIKRHGAVTETEFTAPRPRASCSFERIYVSRGNDPDIYTERKALGAGLAAQVLGAVGHDWGNTIISYIPNTSEVAYYGLMHALRERRRDEVKRALLDAARAGAFPGEAALDELILRNWPRGEKIVSKDIKLRTFIGQEDTRKQLAGHVYDITYGTRRAGADTLVCLDDSIVRGTTLRRSILRMLARLQPKKIVIASTAPQIRYPDCYGIDMSELGKFIAFEAAVSLLKERGQTALMREVYQRCRAELARADSETARPGGETARAGDETARLGDEIARAGGETARAGGETATPAPVNHVAAIYAPFSTVEISRRIAELVRPRNINWDGPIEIIFQTIEDLHAALPNHPGAWYFTGAYPTPGGYRVANQAYVNYYENAEGRSY